MADANSIAMEFDKSSLLMLNRMAKAVPAMFVRAHGRAAAAARRQFSSIMRSGGKPKAGVPKFARLDPFSKQLKSLEGYDAGHIWNRNRQFATDKTYHAMWRSGGAQHVGFPEVLSQWFGKALEAKNGETEKWWRAKLYRKYRGQLQPPKIYSRPERRVIEPWAAYLAKDVFANWVASNFLKMFQKKFGSEFSSSESVTGNEMAQAFGSGTSGKFSSRRGRSGLNSTMRASVRSGSMRGYERANHGW